MKKKLSQKEKISGCMIQKRLKEIIQFVLPSSRHFGMLLEILLDQFTLPLGVHLFFFKCKKIGSSFFRAAKAT